ncbi:hypothetical protein LVD13_05715 [Flavobacteriaceae bacterium D16]|nr:hypothetical protein [Flavobacteriaceae bacterium D16]
MIRRLLLLVLFIGLACKSQDKGKVNAMSEGEQEQGLTLLVSDNYGGSEYADFQVIRDMKTLRRFFARVNMTRKPGLPVPEVDFTKELVILHCPGKMMNGGTPLLMIKENRASKMILTLEHTRDKQKSGIEALTMPFSLYKIPLTEKEIVLQKE